VSLNAITHHQKYMRVAVADIRDIQDRLVALLNIASIVTISIAVRGAWCATYIMRMPQISTATTGARLALIQETVVISSLQPPIRSKSSPAFRPEPCPLSFRGFTVIKKFFCLFVFFFTPTPLLLLRLRLRLGYDDRLPPGLAFFFAALDYIQWDHVMTHAGRGGDLIL